MISLIYLLVGMLYAVELVVVHHGRNPVSVGGTTPKRVC